MFFHIIDIEILYQILINFQLNFRSIHCLCVQISIISNYLRRYLDHIHSHNLYSKIPYIVMITTIEFSLKFDTKITEKKLQNVHFYRDTI